MIAADRGNRIDCTMVSADLKYPDSWVCRITISQGGMAPNSCTVSLTAFAVLVPANQILDQGRADSADQTNTIVQSTGIGILDLMNGG
jgi:hypothetical protein